MGEQNVWKEFAKYNFVEGSVAEIKQNVAQNKSGYFCFIYEGEERVSYYEPLGINNWYIYSTIKKDYIDPQVKTAQDLFFRVLLQLGGILVLLFLYVSWMERKSRKTIEKAHDVVVKNVELMQIAISESKDVIFEYDVKLHSMKVHEVSLNTLFSEEQLDNVPDSLIERELIDEASKDAFRNLFIRIENEPVCECVVKMSINHQIGWYRFILKNLKLAHRSDYSVIGIIEDVSWQMMQQEELQRKEKERRALIAQAIMSLKVDFLHDQVLEINGNVVDTSLSFADFLKKYISNEVDNKTYHYIQKFMLKENLERKFQQGHDVLKTEFKMGADGSRIWVSYVVNYLVEESQQLLFITLNDIDEQKKEELRLRKLAERDGLSGLYNASMMRSMVNDILHQPMLNEFCQVLLLLDLDNFKMINDTFGHMYGDRVLKDTAKILINKFRENDLVARMGGDEFAVLLRDVKELSLIYHIFDELQKELHRVYEKYGKKVEISASIGIAYSPQHGLSFDELYEKADRALYQVKYKYKNGIQIYSDEM